MEDEGQILPFRVKEEEKRKERHKHKLRVTLVQLFLLSFWMSLFFPLTSLSSSPPFLMSQA